MKTPAEQVSDAITALSAIADPGERARHGHAVQEVIKASTPRVRAITDGAVKELRDAGTSLATIATMLGVRVQRVSQMATGRHNGTARAQPPMIYAFRIAEAELGVEASWCGNPDALPEGEFQTGFIDNFSPSVQNEFVGKRLEVRYGPVPDDGLHPGMQAFTTVNGRRVRVTCAVQQRMFAGPRR